MSESDQSKAGQGEGAQLGRSIHDRNDPAVHASLTRYWRANIIAMLCLLLVWALAGLVCGILIADLLNSFSTDVGGAPLGFWFAQQGSIIIFVLLILIYALYMNRLDKKHHDELEQIRKDREQRTGPDA